MVKAGRKKLSPLLRLEGLTKRAVYALFFLFLLYFYTYINRWMGQYPERWQPVEIWLDAYLPFVPSMVLLYISWYFQLLVYGLYFFFRRGEGGRDFFLHLMQLCFCFQLVSDAIFLLWPTTVSRTAWQALPPIWQPFFDFLSHNDFPINCLPSNHVGLSLLFAYGLHLCLRARRGQLSKEASRRRLLGWLQALSLVWTFLICLSTLLIRQHALLDVLSAALLVLLLLGGEGRRKVSLAQLAQAA